MKVILLTITVFLAAVLVNGAPRFTSLVKGAQCGVRLPKTRNVRDRARGLFRIGNGYSSHKNQWPWMISMLFFSSMTRVWRHGCGGSVIHPQYLLTAAHCVKAYEDTPSRIRIRFAEHHMRDRENEQFDSEVQRIFVHRGYTESMRSVSIHDIALLKLDKPLTLDHTINVVCIPVQNRRNLEGQIMTISGWGRTITEMSPESLLHVEVPVMTDSACKDGWRNYFSNLTNQFCTDVVRSRDSCKGDSGGPVMIHEDGRWIQYGVVSAGSSECGSNALPSLNVDVAGYLPWIKSIIFDNIRLDAGNTSSIFS